MTVGRVLWTVILIKLFVIFVVLKLLFFPDVLAQKAKGGDKAEVVASELTNRK
jgi:conserved domain protein